MQCVTEKITKPHRIPKGAVTVEKFSLKKIIQILFVFRLSSWRLVPPSLLPYRIDTESFPESFCARLKT